MPARVRALLTGAVGAGLAMVFLFADGETVHGAGWAALPLALWWLIPFAIGLLGARSLVGCLLVAAVAAFAVARALTAIYTSHSSTAAIGLLTLPVPLAVLVAGCLLAERLSLRRISNTR